jgi:hypothetical protein
MGKPEGRKSGKRVSQTFRSSSFNESLARQSLGDGGTWREPKRVVENIVALLPH